MYNSMSALRLAGRVLVPFAFIFAGVLGGFLIIAWLTNSLQLPVILWPFSSQNSPFSLMIQVEPKASVILLNTKPYVPGSTPLPGDYTIKITHDGYLPVEEEIRIHPNEKNLFTFRLVPVASTVLVARTARFAGWDQNGSLFFLVIPENKLYRWTKGTLAPVLGLEQEAYQLLYLPSGERVIALFARGPDAGSFLQSLDLKTGTSADLEGNGMVSLGTDGETLWGFNYDTESNADKPIWKLPLDGKIQLVSLENPQWAMFGEQLILHPSNPWMAIESARGIAIWDIGSGKLLATFENASTPVWVENPDPGLAYLSPDGSLKFARPDENWKTVTLLGKIQAPIAAMPGASEVIFARYNPFEGGSSLWAIDTETGGLRLLAEARTESGKAEQILVSPNGNRIAFVNDKNILFLVTLEP